MKMVAQVSVTGRQLHIHFVSGRYLRRLISSNGTVELAGEFSPADLNRIARELNRAIRQERMNDECPDGFIED